jgi:hypothetical protein
MREGDLVVPSNYITYKNRLGLNGRSKSIEVNRANIMRRGRDGDYRMRCEVVVLDVSK